MLNKDKIMHFVAGAFIASMTVSVSTIWESNRFWLASSAISSAFLAGSVKELYDLLSQKGTSEWADLWATALGGLAAAVIVVTCM